ncbi:YggS family pyridoxal phosphate-dependent enzyme [Imperialibacter roseus]|mgnify:CR=1 FL=1|uniref:Pyridoxal phosphate homeostasis protein n=1 Tax=Imperialibacter roseus TaxID=1324217 RepID=A0ABZ0IRL5_9BACT|nr:YggS family pyridoxal phosphate-dependent enzyme [Imperialibacter roseus]WOK07639.1 YggS family pyridoxal phosphate-dependent enzyme [Imperialibacter roseus]|tara:strand:+ start:31429 stop:32112 length:684 start_codon:yes stop_codon:yes gene_type:complete
MDIDIGRNLQTFLSTIDQNKAKLIAVSKTKPVSLIMKAYEAGQREFGENKVQEMVEKHEEMPKDIHWHLIGHLQTNKVKYIAPFVHLIHSVDSEKLLRTIDKEAKKTNRVIDCLLQVHIAEEETKFGLSDDEARQLLSPEVLDGLPNVRIVGLMGMATNTESEEQVKKEFRHLKALFGELKSTVNHTRVIMAELSMGMSGDYQLAIEEGSTMVRVGSAIFGQRNYSA